MMPSVPQLLVIFGFLLVFVAPAIHVLASSRSHGGAKFGWFLATVLFSLLGYIVFLIVTQNAKDAKTHGMGS